MSTEIDNAEQLRRYQERYHYGLKAAHICIFEVDVQRQLYTVFNNAEDIFNKSGEQILAEVQPFSKLPPEEYRLAASAYFAHPEDEETINEAFRNILRGEPATYQARMKAGDTGFIWCKVDVTPIMENGIPVRMIGVITDINQLKDQIGRLEIKSRLDGFTRLYSKAYAETLMKKTLKDNPGKNHALLILDLDNFKEINDTYGHDMGDEVLKSVAANLPEVLDRSDVIGRFGGDEFVVLIAGYPSREALCERLDRLLDASDNACRVTKSIGVSLFPEHGSEFPALFKKADEALYRAKEKKNRYVIFGE